MQSLESQLEKVKNSCYIHLYNKDDCGFVAKTQVQILHYPRLDTVLMVEDFVRKHSGEFRKRGLWESLPKKTMYQTFCVIMDYLEKSGKIGFDGDGRVAWVWNPELVRKYLGREDLSWRAKK